MIPNARLLSVLIALGLAWTSTSHATPSVWQDAAHPKRAAARDHLERSQTWLEANRKEPLVVGEGREADRLRRALRLAQPGSRLDSQSWRLQHHLASLYSALYRLDPKPTYLELALQHLHRVVALGAPQTVAADAYDSIATSEAHLGRHHRSAAAYDQVIARAPEIHRQSLLLANQAEAWMALGQLDRAVSGYRASIDLAPTTAAHVLNVTTRWGLAVALDRSGDLSGAFDNVRRARGFDPRDRLLNGPNWFFVPPYDAHWYAALGHWLDARNAPPPKRINLLRLAERDFARYVAEAPPKDRFVPLARLRRQQCQQQRELLKRR